MASASAALAGVRVTHVVNFAHEDLNRSGTTGDGYDRQSEPTNDVASSASIV